MIIIYLETNSLMAIAKGRNKELEDFIYHRNDNLKFVIPSVCLMESLVAIEREDKRSNSFAQTAKIEISEAKRSKELTDSQSFANYLELSLIDYDLMSGDFRKRFLHILAYLKINGELIEPNIAMLEKTFSQPLLLGNNKRRDDFIIQVILAHAENNLAITKAFFSENSKEFSNSNIPHFLANLGITYFSQISNLKAWLNQQQN